MDDNLANPTEINIEDFIKIYPPIPNQANNSLFSNKFVKIFTMRKLIRKCSTTVIKKSSRKSKSVLEFNSFNTINNPNDENYNIENNIDKDLINKQLIKDIRNNDSQNYDYNLLAKAIELQNKTKKRTMDIKNALNQFFSKSDLISKLSEFFKKYGPNISDEGQKTKIFDDNILRRKNSKEILIENRIQEIIQKLVDNTKIEKYEKNEYIIKMNEIGKNCYFLISGRLSILKPAFYKNINISYENYFKYIISLISNKEVEIARQIIELNKEFINVVSLKDMLEIIKIYCITKVRNNIKKLDENKTFNLNKIEKALAQFNLTLSDYNLNKNEILYNINKIIEENSLNMNIKGNKRIFDYFLKITSPTKEDLFTIKAYNFLFKNPNSIQNENDNFNPMNRTNFATLAKYEIFMQLDPGAFFGETALENESYRRNASVRAEESCFIASLDGELYNAIFLEENKRLKIKDVHFICSNFFFRDISPVIFNKYYYPMLKLISKEKNDIIYLQDSKISSIFLLKEGSIKNEISASILELNQIIKTLIESLIRNKKNFKIDNNILNNIREKYLLNKKIFNSKNQNHIMNKELRKKYKYDISSSEEYETMGILEFFMNINCIHSCYANSQEVRLFEINRDYLEKILNSERDIYNSYYILVYSKIISTIKRLYSLEQNFINQIEDKINTNFYSEKSNKDDNLYNDINFNFNSDIKSLSQNYENFGFCEKSILFKRKKFYSPIKFSNLKKNYFIKGDIKQKENLFNKENKKSIYIQNNFKLNIKPIIIKENINMSNTNDYKSIIPTEDPLKRVKNMKKSLSIGNIVSSKEKQKDKNKVITDTFRNKDSYINIGKSTLSLKSLKHQILMKKEEKIGNLSILKNSMNSILNSLDNNIDNKMDNFNKNIFLKKMIKLKDKKTKYNIDIYLQENKIQNADSLPAISSKRKIPEKNIKSLKKIKSTFYDINNSIKNFFEEENNKNENILSKYIKKYYNNKKKSGYIGLVRVENCRYIKKK